MRERYKEKLELVQKLSLDKGTDALNNVVALAELLINETREENDRVSIDEMRYNQGKIEGYKIIMNSILVGLPVRMSNK